VSPSLLASMTSSTEIILARLFCVSVVFMG
jgi:hypothetical protein